jgi:hypothetical protein
MDNFTFAEEQEEGQIEDLQNWRDALFFEWTYPHFKRVALLKPQAQGGNIRMIVQLSDGTEHQLTHAQVEAFLNSENFNFNVRNRLAANNIWLHHNRNGRWAMATGQEPAVWPEDEVV